MTRKAYFPILDPLRFAASICVLLAHSVVFFRPGKAHVMQFPGLIRNAGYYGVIFFYVLSGFLITYLLLTEKDNTGKIHVAKFYMRRVLRIWPLYYLIIALSFFVLPSLWPWKEYWQSGIYPVRALVLYILFLPNIASLTGPVFMTCFQTYTIGYEEQFYLFWPWVIKAAKKYMLPVLLVLFFGYILLELFHLWLMRQTPDQHGGIIGMIKISLTVINLSNMSAFIAGALAAFVYWRGTPEWLERMRWRGLSYLLTLVIFYVMYSIRPQGAVLVSSVSLLYACLILHLILRPDPQGKWQQLLSKGGKVSYGIYMFHPMVLIFVSACLRKVPIADMRLSYVLYLGLSTGLVMIVSLLGYRWVELPFLRKKQLFSAPWKERNSLKTPPITE